MNISSIIVPITTGLATGLVLYLSAAGMNLMISGLDVINFGQGAFFVLGAGSCVFLVEHGVNFALAVVISTVIAMVCGAILEFLLRPVVGKRMQLTLMITMGVAYIMSELIEMAYGSKPRTTQIPKALSGVFKIGVVMIPKYYAFLIVISLFIAFMLWLIFQKTKLGMIFRAIIADRKMTEALGINVQLIYMLMFVIGVGLSGLAGAINLPVGGFDATTSMSAFAGIFPILVIGGLGNMQGTLPAAMVVGVITAITAIVAPDFFTFISSICMIICILIKPEGLFTRRKVR